MARGDECEREASLQIHSQGIPLLIAPSFLRRLGGGQIDVALLKKSEGGWSVNLYEVKSGNALSNNQLNRIRKSAIVLSTYFSWDVTFQFWGQYSRQNFKDHLIY